MFRVGQRLSDEQVLVKQVEMNEGSDPIVILEQYSIEVADGRRKTRWQAGTSTNGSQKFPGRRPNAEETGSLVPYRY